MNRLFRWIKNLLRPWNRDEWLEQKKDEIRYPTMMELVAGIVAGVALASWLTWVMLGGILK